MTDQAIVHTIEHADPSPVPESNWLWRRVYTFTVTALLVIHVYWTALRTDDIATLRETIRNDQGLIVLFALLYLAGASAEAIGGIIASIRTSKKETITTAPPPARIVTPEATVTTPTAKPTIPDKPSWQT